MPSTAGFSFGRPAASSRRLSRLLSGTHPAVAPALPSLPDRSHAPHADSAALSLALGSPAGFLMNQPALIFAVSITGWFRLSYPECVYHASPPSASLSEPTLPDTTLPPHPCRFALPS